MNDMRPSREFVARLAIGTPGGPYSSSLRIWSSPQKSDVYASVRERAGDFKISLHGSGECIAGLTTKFAAAQASAVTSMGGSRHSSKWSRATHVGSRFVTPLQFALPASELRTWRAKRVHDPKLTWLRPPDPGHSVIVTCGFSGQRLLDDEWPGRANGTYLGGTKLLPNGEKFWLLWQYCPTSELELAMLSEARELLRRPGMIHFGAVTDNTPPAPRILIFKDIPTKRMLVVLDAAAE